MEISLRDSLLASPDTKQELRDQYLALENKQLRQIATLTKVKEDNKICYFGKPGQGLQPNPKQAEILK